MFFRYMTFFPEYFLIIKFIVSQPFPVVPAASRLVSTNLCQQGWHGENDCFITAKLKVYESRKKKNNHKFQYMRIFT